MKTRVLIILFYLVSACFYNCTYTTNKDSYEINKNINFRGVVQSVKYDEKGFPTIKLDDKYFYLEGPYNFNFKIEKGDILIKQKGSTSYKLVKQISHEIIIFNGW